jgi:hypothetical protein
MAREYPNYRINEPGLMVPLSKHELVVNAPYEGERKVVIFRYQFVDDVLSDRSAFSTDCSISREYGR